MIETLPRVWVSPMSPQIVESVKSAGDLGFTTTRHQVGSPDSYLYDNNMILTLSGVVCERDHGGNDILPYLTDAGHLYDILHIDPWKGEDDLYNGIDETCYLINAIHALHPEVMFEIGTEEKVFPYDAYTLGFILESIQKNVSPSAFDQIVYVVIQGGANVYNCSNVVFNEAQFIEMLKIVHEYEKLGKEHNCDFLSPDDLRKRLELGLDSYNIGPAVVYEQNKRIMEDMNHCELERLQQYCEAQNEWQRWTDKPELIIPCTLHYYAKDLLLPEIDMTDVIKEIIR